VAMLLLFCSELLLRNCELINIASIKIRKVWDSVRVRKSVSVNNSAFSNSATLLKIRVSIIGTEWESEKEIQFWLIIDLNF